MCELEERVVQLQREKLQEQSEKLRAAKALVELEVDGQDLVDAKEAEVTTYRDVDAHIFI